MENWFDFSFSLLFSIYMLICHQQYKWLDLKSIAHALSFGSAYVFQESYLLYVMTLILTWDLLAAEGCGDCQAMRQISLILMVPCSAHCQHHKLLKWFKSCPSFSYFISMGSALSYCIPPHCLIFWWETKTADVVWLTNFVPWIFSYFFYEIWVENFAVVRARQLKGNLTLYSFFLSFWYIIHYVTKKNIFWS